MLQSHFKNYEVHNVTTEDGYILGLFRIRVETNEDKKKGIVVLLHPILTDSTIWVSQGNTSLGMHQ